MSMPRVNAERALPLLGLFLLLHFAVLLAYVRHLNIDVAFFITMGQMILDGALPFRDIFDNNPPTAMYLGVLPLWLRELTSLDIVRSAHVITAVALALSGVLSLRALRHMQLPDLRALRYVFAAAWIYLAVLTLSMTQFGQRDQLIIAFLFPYALLRAAVFRQRVHDAVLEIFAVAFAALALLLKPMYGGIPLLIEIAVLAHAGWRSYLQRMRTPVIVLVLCAIALLSLEAMRLYYFDWFGVISEYYRSFGYDIKRVLFTMAGEQGVQFSVLVFFLGVVMWSSHRERGMRDLFLMLLLLFAGGFAGMLLQGKGWDYHRLPMTYATWMLAGFTLYAVVHAFRKRTPRAEGAAVHTVLLFAVLQLALFPTITSWLRLGGPRAPDPPLLQVIARHSAESDGIVAVNPGVEITFPAITCSGRRYVSHFLQAFPLVMGYAGQEAQSAIPERRWFVDRYKRILWEDVASHRPRLLLVDANTGRWNLPDTMSALTWLRAEGFFRGDGPGRDYELVERTVNRIAVFRRRDRAD